MLDLLITTWNSVPDAVRFMAIDTPLLTVLRLVAMVTGSTLFEDGSIG